ncbi:MAG: radical SAM protein [Planctomycetes bacterium]|nr:radical SAM protein [Planctomycetota bacterium]
MPRRAENPPNPWHGSHVELLGPPPDVELEVYEEECKSILSKNDSDDLPFRFSVNPYRGCFHGCAYCYARPTHEYLDWGAGTDFDRRIVVKTNAAEVLRRQLSSRAWTRETIVFSGVTDCYQPIEAAYGITRACLEACAEFANPVSVVTKGALCERDVDVFERLRARATFDIAISVPFADDADGRAIEPFAAPPSRRFETIRRLADRGLPVSVAIAPVIPGLNDHQIPEILARAADAGAWRASLTLLRLPKTVLPVFESRLAEAFPDRTKKVWNALTEMRDGVIQESRTGRRMRGTGTRWRMIAQLFELHRKRLGLAASDSAVFVERSRPDRRQGELF